MKIRKIKTILALALSTIFVTNFLNISIMESKPVLAAPLGVHVNSDFENFSGRVTEKKSHTDSFGNVSWLYNANENSYFENRSKDNFKGNSLALVNTNNDNAGIYISKPSVALKDKFIFETDMNFTDMNLERKVAIKLNSDESDMYQISFNKNGTITLSNYTKAFGIQALGIISKKNYQTDKWYNVKFVVDQAINEISIYLNNELLDTRIFDVRPWDMINELRIIQSGHVSVEGGEVLVDNLRIYDYASIETIELKDVIIRPNSSVAVQKIVSPQIADSQLIYTSSDESIVSVDDYGIITSGNEKGIAQITATSLDGKISTSCEVKVDEVVQIEEIILPSDLQIQKGENLNLNELVTILPENTTNKNLVWNTQDERKLKVDANGNLTGVNWGDVNITAKTQDGNKVATTNVKVRHIVNSPEIDKNEYKVIREKCFYNLTGGDYDYNDASIKKMVDEIFEQANTYWNNMNKDKSNRDHIWNDLSDSEIKNQGLDEKTTNIKLSDAITTSYRRLETMLRAYHMKNSPLKGNEELLNDILDALDWMYANKYNENLNVEYGNWWNWEIGTPLALTNIGILVRDKIDIEILEKYMKPIYFYQPDPFNSCFRELNPTNKDYKPTTGANRSDCAKIAGVLGAVLEDYEQVAMARDAIETLLGYVNSGDGFYTDGSFLQHDMVPYIGSYGYVFLTGVPTVADILKDSSFEVSKEKIGILKEFVDNSLVPFIYKGSMLDMTRGRAISRYNVTDKTASAISLNTIMMVARVLDNEQDKEELYSYVKGMIELDPITNIMESIDYKQHPISMVSDLNNLINGNTKGEVDETYHAFTPIQDRVIHAREGYALGVSMFSKRTSNFESMNNENKRGWHTNSGMTYLYNGDLDYYKDFWPTVNPYRLPGTTVDPVEMIDAKGNKCTSDKEWVGGTTLDNYGVNGMAYHQVGPKGLINTSTGQVDRLSLEANKSWFMFDDEIVALGSGINSKDGRNIETIIDNIKLKEDNSNKVVINGKSKVFDKIEQNIALNPIPTEDEYSIDNVDTIFVEGNKKGTSIGYYFPKSTKLNFRNVENIGTWQSIGSSGPTENNAPKEIKNNYLEIWSEHGINPENESYEYVILPNNSEAKVKNYKKSPSIEVLSNTNELQGVKHKKLQILSFNNFVDDTKELEYLTVNKKASVMSRIEKKSLEISISDPTMKNNEGIILTIDKNKLPKKNIKSLVMQDNENVQILEENKDMISLLVNVADKKGDTVELEFEVR